MLHSLRKDARTLLTWWRCRSTELDGSGFMWRPITSLLFGFRFQTWDMSHNQRRWEEKAKHLSSKAMCTVLNRRMCRINLLFWFFLRWKRAPIYPTVGQYPWALLPLYTFSVAYDIQGRSLMCSSSSREVQLAFSTSSRGIHYPGPLLKR